MGPANIATAGPIANFKHFYYAILNEKNCVLSTCFPFELCVNDSFQRHRQKEGKQGLRNLTIKYLHAKKRLLNYAFKPSGPQNLCSSLYLQKTTCLHRSRKLHDSRPYSEF